MKEPSFLKRKLGLGRKDKHHDKEKSEQTVPLSPLTSDIPPFSPRLGGSSVPASPSPAAAAGKLRDVSTTTPRSLTPEKAPVFTQPVVAKSQAQVPVPSAPTPRDAARALRASSTDGDEVFVAIQKEVEEEKARAEAKKHVESVEKAAATTAEERTGTAESQSGGSGKGETLESVSSRSGTLKLDDPHSIPDKLSELLDVGIEVLQHLFGLGGYTMLQEILRWSMIVQIFAAVLITYFMASFHVWAVVTVPLMIMVIWLIWAVHLRSVTTVIRTQTRLDFILSGMMPEKESAWWLNMVMRSCWPIFLRDFLNQVVVPKLAPWFLNKYKPPMLLRVDVMNVDMGDRGPVVSNIRMVQGVAGDSHVELEMDIEVASADNMFIQCGAKVLGMSAITWEAFVTGMHLTGTIRVSLKFTNNWKQGFIERVAVMFPTPPQLSCAIRVMGGLDAASMPLAAGYVEATLQAALNAALVWPNRILVIDAVKAVCHLMDLPVPESEDSEGTLAFGAPTKSVKMTRALASGQQAATAVVEILEGEDLIAADSGGTSDPYVKGTLGPARFTTSVVMKTLNPKWTGERYDLPVEDWTREESYKLILKVRDYDKFTSDDDLGWASVDLRQFRGGMPQEMLLDLHDVDSGSLLVRVTIKDDVGLTEEEREKLLEEKKAQETERAKKLAGLLGKIDKEAAEAAAGMLGSIEAFDPKSAASQAGRLIMSKYWKATDSLVRNHVLPKALLGGEVAAVVDIQIVDGTNLMAADKGGTSDPYVKGFLGRSKFTTQVIYKTLNPVWLEKHKLYVKNWPNPDSGEKCIVQLKVFDRDRSMKDDFLGETEIDLDKYRDGEQHELILPLKKAKSGSIRVTFKVIDLEAAAEDAPDLEQAAAHEAEVEAEKEAVEAKWKKSQSVVKAPSAQVAIPKAGDDYSHPGVLVANKTPAGVLTGTVREVPTGPAEPAAKSYVKVEIIEAQDLEAKDPSGTSDPFVRGTLGSVQFSTKHINKTLNPQWYDAFKLPIVEWHSDSTLLTVEVFDKNTMVSNASIGRCLINLNRFQDGMRHNLWLRLENAKSGKIHVAITNLADTMEVKAELLEVIPGIVVESWKIQSEHLKRSMTVSA